MIFNFNLWFGQVSWMNEVLCVYLKKYPSKTPSLHYGLHNLD